MSQRLFRFFIVTTPGLVSVTRREIEQLAIKIIAEEEGGLLCEGGLRHIMRANLCLRTASRVLVRIGSFRATHLDHIARPISKMPWRDYLFSDPLPHVVVTAKRSRLWHKQAIMERVQAGLAQCGLKQQSNKQAEGQDQIATHSQEIHIRVKKDHFICSINSSGVHLHKRGYKTLSSAAPMRETLASGLLGLLHWHGQCDLLDPMCGSGTIAIEAAMIASRKAPGLYRDFIMQGWSIFSQKLWRQEVKRANKTEDGFKRASCKIWAGDHDAAVCQLAQQNIKQAIKQQELITLKQQPFSQWQAPCQQGLIIMNPPYGIRIGNSDQLVKLYKSIGRHYKEHFPSWHLAIVCDDEQLIKYTGVTMHFRSAWLYHGGLRVRLFATDVLP